MSGMRTRSLNGTFFHLKSTVSLTTSLLRQTSSIVMFLPCMRTTMIGTVSSGLHLMTTRTASFRSAELLMTAVKSSAYVTSSLFSTITMLLVCPNTVFMKKCSTPRLKNSAVAESETRASSRLKRRKTTSLTIQWKSQFRRLLLCISSLKRSWLFP